MVIGFVLRLDPNSYLLLGLPITVVFQLLVRKAPLRALWVRKAPPLSIGKLKPAAQLVALAFALANWVILYEYVVSHSWILVLYELVAIVGTIPLAYAIHNFTRQMVRPLLMCFATAGSVVVGLDLTLYLSGVYQQHSLTPVTLGGFVITWTVSMVQYLPVVFLIEEVWFRGAFDSHIYHLGEKYPNLTAIYVSLLWGAWHFPMVYTPSMGLNADIGVLMELLVLQGIVGSFLSVYWRQSGKLLVPGSVHAFVDSVRNGLGLF